MLPVYSPKSHSLYQDFLISNFLLYYPDPFSISRQTWKIIVQFWHLDLSQTTNILLGSYSKFGPAPRDPVSMLRSYLLSIKLKITSITDWVSRLKECPLYAIISGFSPDIQLIFLAYETVFYPLVLSNLFFPHSSYSFLNYYL